MTNNITKERENSGLEEETINLLTESILDALEAEKELEEESFEITYYKDRVSSEQFDRIYKISKFVLDIFFPFPNFDESEYTEDGHKHRLIRVFDDEGIFHTCFIDILFIYGDEYTIQPVTCHCSEIYNKIKYMIPSVLSLDSYKIWLCIESTSCAPAKYQDRFKSLAKMYAGNNLVEAWTHIGFLAEQLTRQIYLNTYETESEDSTKDKVWSRLLKRLQSENEKPLIQHLAFLIDSIRPLRNEVTHHEYVPTTDDIEFGILAITRVMKIYFLNSSP